MLSELLHAVREQAGGVAVVALGVAMVAGIVVSLLALRRIRRGGLGAGAKQRFFADRRAIERWFRSH